MKKYVLGIDPDIERSGIALLNRECKAFEVVCALPFCDVLHYIDTLDAEQTLVVLEDSNNADNWHLGAVLRSGLPLQRKLRVAAAMGRSVGMCHAVIRLLTEYVADKSVELVLQKPLKKTWRGKDGKITQAEAEQFMRGLPKRCNQECRDAALLAWNYANFPIRMHV